MRSRTGGPAPAETRRMAVDRKKRIEENERLIVEMRGRVDRALSSLREMR